MSGYTALSSEDDEQEAKDRVNLLPLSGTNHFTPHVIPSSCRKSTNDSSLN